MFDNAAREFLQKTLIARLSVIDPEGYPHPVPGWFMLEGADISSSPERSTRKVGYIQHNSKAP